MTAKVPGRTNRRVRMKIKAGKSYRTVKGEKADVAEHHPDSGRRFPFRGVSGGGVSGGGVLWWDENGNSLIDGDHDIVAEWTDAEPVPPCGGEVPTGPTRTVTRLEVVPGVYDGVVVGDRTENFVSVEFQILLADADQLERAAAVLTELAKAVRDGQ